MGRFVNPGNSAFQTALNSEIYIDKTGLLEYTNRVLDTKQAMICNSRPRRFGKSITADMITAYYCRECDSEEMFLPFEIGQTQDFRKHLNKYDVIHLDIQWCCMDAGEPEKTVEYINANIIAELKEIYPDIISDQINTAYGALSCVNAALGVKFIVVIDEWDVLIRDEAMNQSIQEEYINFLRGMFKGSEPTKFLHLAYLTGILPIKKLKTQSALNNFEQFTMLDASVFAPYIGFTEEEVKSLCVRYNKDFEMVKKWYDGYILEDYQVYNPKAVVSVMTRNKFESYWSQTGTYESIMPLINMNFDGLKAAIVEMIAGGRVRVRTSSYQNDMISFRNKDDVLTLMIHLGYLAYDGENHCAFVPNEEIRSELTDAVEDEQWNEFVDLQLKSDQLLKATWEQDEETVAQAIETIHSEYTSALVYNSENSLSSVVSIAYLGAMKYYFKPVREMPAGYGFADLVFIPKRKFSEIPALIVELKWNKSAQTALEQIKQKKYVQALAGYTGEALLVGINYSRQSKKHECMIEKVTINEASRRTSDLVQ